MEKEKMEKRFSVRFDDDTWEMIERRAKAWDVNPCDYVRHAILFEALSAADVGAIKLFGKNLQKFAGDTLRKYLVGVQG